MEPAQRLNEELRKQGLSEMQFFLLKHGESRLIEIKEADKDGETEENETKVELDVPVMDDAGEDAEERNDAQEEETTQEEADQLQQLVDGLVEDTPDETAEE